MTRRGWFHLGGIGLLLCLPLLALAADPPAPKGPSADRPAASGEGYVVKKGDTLWGISKDLFEDPFLWPRIWERNPYLKDPNRIYPGDTLALPGKELTPAPAPPKVEPPKPAPPVAAAPPPPPPPPAPAPQAAPPSPPPPPPTQPPLGEHALACMPAVLPEAMIPGVSTGKILGSEKGALLLADLDTVYVGLTGGQNYAVGSRLSVVRPGRRVIHPLTKKSLGKVLYTLGILEVLEDLGKSLKTRVVYSCGAISVGDLVQAYAMPPYPVGKEIVAATRQLSGTIVESLYGESLLGQYSIVFVDLGTARGAAPGDVFSVLRPGTPIVEGNARTGQVYPVSPQDLASGTVVRVAQDAATLVLTQSLQVAVIGDTVVLSHQVRP